MPELRVEDIQILLLEMQRPIVASSRTVSSETLRRAADTLKTMARAAGIPMTASAVPLGGAVPQLIDELSGMEVLTRHTVGALQDPALASRLGVTGRRTLIVGGVCSEIAVLHSTLQALNAGYDVHVLLDLCGGLDARTEQGAFARMWAAGAKPSSVSGFATGLIDDMTTDLGQTVMQALDRHWRWGAHCDEEPAGTASVNDAELQAIFSDMTNGWRDGDAKRFAAVFSKNARFVAFDGSILAGPDGIAAYHAQPFATYLAGTTLEFGPLAIERLTDDQYVVASEGSIVRPGSRGELVGRSAQTFLIQRRLGKLRITNFQNTRVRPIDGPRAAEVWKRFDEEWAKLARETHEGPASLA